MDTAILKKQAKIKAKHKMTYKPIYDYCYKHFTKAQLSDTFKVKLGMQVVNYYSKEDQIYGILRNVSGLKTLVDNKFTKTKLTQEEKQHIQTIVELFVKIFNEEVGKIQKKYPKLNRNVIVGHLMFGFPLKQ